MGGNCLKRAFGDLVPGDGRAAGLALPGLGDRFAVLVEQFEREMLVNTKEGAVPLLTGSSLCRAVKSKGTESVKRLRLRISHGRIIGSKA